MNVIDKLSWLHLKDRKVLTVRSKNKDRFYSPGGKREAGESDEQALIREIKEEVGVDLWPNTIRYANTFQAQAHGKPEGVMVEIKCYWAEYDGVLQPQTEIEELGWFTSKDMDRASAPGKLILTWLKDHDFID